MEDSKEPSIEEDQCHKNQKFYVYCLKAISSETTYVGATTDVNRRLRQHNKEIKGGAKATSVKVNQGDSWERVCYVEGFPDWKSALQFEWMWKYCVRRSRHRSILGKMAPFSEIWKFAAHLHNLSDWMDSLFFNLSVQ